ncbi:MAG: PAS domain-containing sensor histidine kinase [Bacteroidetes bacterium]|nr:MAG: PAS domain-containing sensor histidine kinase [Bacteroidota bacterium]
MKRLFRSTESDYHQVNALFENATEGIVLTNGEGNIVLINPSALKLFHYELKDVLGMPIETLIPTRFHSAHSNYRKDFYQHPSNRAMGHGRELYARTKDGSEFPVEVSLSYYSHQKELFVIAFIVDITLRKESEKAMLNQKKKLEAITEDMRKLNFELETKVEQRTLILREALQELEKSQKELNEALNKEKELNEIKSRFVSMASHEFRTPLSTILSSAALISKYTKSEDQEKRDKHTKRIRDSVKHLNELLEDFLSLGKLEEGRINAHGGDFSISEFADETVDEMKTILKDRQQIHLNCSGADHFVSDKRLLKNILINLISNSVKFSPERGGIWLSMENHDEELEIIVRDEGVGISESDQQHLFSSFFRGANANNVEGTGLGLHIVKRYIELLHGNIELQSQLHKGTTITMKIPALPSEDQRC